MNKTPRYTTQIKKFLGVHYYEYANATPSNRRKQRIDLSVTGTNSEIIDIINNNMLLTPADYTYANYNDQQIRHSLHAVTGIDSDDITLTAGAEDALRIITTILYGENITVGITVPTFSRILLYDQITRPKKVAYYPMESDDFIINSDHLHEFIEKNNIDVLITTNPNTPTGCFTPIDTLVAVATSHPDTMFVIDFSLYNFVLDGTVLKPLHKLKNVILCFSFSKVFGVPGIRLGFIATKNKDLTGSVRNVISPFGISSLTLKIGNFLLGNDKVRSILKKEKSLIVRNFNYLATFDNRIIKVIGAPGYNCMVTSLKEKSLYDFLQQKGIKTIDTSKFIGIHQRNSIRIFLNKFPFEQYASILQQYMIEYSI